MCLHLGCRKLEEMKMVIEVLLRLTVRMKFSAYGNRLADSVLAYLILNISIAIISSESFQPKMCH